jgi:hypothetical protein
METPHKAYEELKNIRRSIDKGEAGYTLTPNLLTRSLHAIFSPKVSTANIMRGFKTYNREVISAETDMVSVTNCADSAHKVVSEGGISLERNIFSYSTPSGINQFFTKHKASLMAKKDESIKSISENQREP